MFHPALCVTDDEPAVTAALATISPAVMSALLGEEATATIEIAPLPDELRGRLTSGTTAISFGVDDLEGRVAACRSAGLTVTVVPGDVAFAVVTVAGVEFELVQF